MVTRKQKLQKIRNRVKSDSHWGDEPVITEDSSSTDLVLAHNWYNYNHDNDDAKAFVIQYLKQDRQHRELIKKISKVESHKLQTLGWNCRILSRGGFLPEEKVKDIFDKLNAFVIEADEPTPDEPPTVSVRDRVEKRASQVIADIETEVDKFILDGENDVNFSTFFNDRAIKPQIAKIIYAYYFPLYTELMAAVEGKDPYLKEYYSHLKKTQLKKYMIFIKSIISTCDVFSYVVVVSRKPRAKKEKPAGVLVTKLNYCKEFEELGIKSVPPASIIGCQQLWCYNTKYRDLTVYNAIGPAGLSVKGTTLTGFDENASMTKRLRKPKEKLDLVASSAKTGLRKIMEGINGKPRKPTGRINTEVVLIRTVK